MIKYKYILLFRIHCLLIYILYTYPHHEQEEIGPYMAEPVYEITSLYLAKKGSDDHQWKYQNQESYKYYNPVNAIDHL